MKEDNVRLQEEAEKLVSEHQKTIDNLVAVQERNKENLTSRIDTLKAEALVNRQVIEDLETAARTNAATHSEHAQAIEETKSTHAAAIEELQSEQATQKRKEEELMFWIEKTDAEAISRKKIIGDLEAAAKIDAQKQNEHAQATEELKLTHTTAIDKLRSEYAKTDTEHAQAIEELNPTHAPQSKIFNPSTQKQIVNMSKLLSN